MIGRSDLLIVVIKNFMLGASVMLLQNIAFCQYILNLCTSHSVNEYCASSGIVCNRNLAPLT